MLIAWLIQHFSYTVLFFWSLMEGEIGLALAGYKIQTGRFDPEYVLLIAISAAIIGDTSVFLIGKFFKKRTEELLMTYQKRLKHIETWFLRYGSWIIVFERFIYGTHIPALLMIGVSGFGFMKFLLLDVIGVILWAFTFTALGYFFGQTVIDILTIVQRHLTILMLAALFFFTVYQLAVLDDAEEDAEKEK